MKSSTDNCSARKGSKCSISLSFLFCINIWKHDDFEIRAFRAGDALGGTNSCVKWISNFESKCKTRMKQPCEWLIARRAKFQMKILHPRRFWTWTKLIQNSLQPRFLETRFRKTDCPSGNPWSENVQEAMMSRTVCLPVGQSCDWPIARRATLISNEKHRAVLMVFEACFFHRKRCLCK